MLARTALYLLLVQALATVVIASAVPDGAAWLTVAGFVTPYYDSNMRVVGVVQGDARRVGVGEARSGPRLFQP